MRQSPPVPGKRQNKLIPLLIILVLVAVAFRLVFGHPASKYETIATDVTAALQKNDVAAVKSYQNAETATHVTDERVGRAADALAPLGKLIRVRQSSADDRVHHFEATFEKGTLAETITFDPQDKIVGFHYDQPVLTR